MLHNKFGMMRCFCSAEKYIVKCVYKDCKKSFVWFCFLETKVFQRFPKDSHVTGNHKAELILVSVFLVFFVFSVMQL